MVYISKVYTRSGDRGSTHLVDGSEVAKSSPRVHAYGEVDELNACIGWIRLEIVREPRRDGHRALLERLDQQMARVQQELFDLGAELATPGSDPRVATIDDASIGRLEQEIDGNNELLQPLQSFILPGGGPVGTAAHFARTVCRRAERATVELHQHEPVRDELLRYLNRLSDHLFVLARLATSQLGHDEVLWTPKSS